MMEKPALLTVQMLRVMLLEVFGEALAHKLIRELLLISYLGTHFASYRFLDYILYDVPNEFRIDTSHVFGMPHHTKGPCDQQGGKLRHWRDDYALSYTISNETDLLEAYKACEAKRFDTDPTGDKNMFSLILPGQKAFLLFYVFPSFYFFGKI